MVAVHVAVMHDETFIRIAAALVVDQFSLRFGEVTLLGFNAFRWPSKTTAEKHPPRSAYMGAGPVAAALPWM